MIVGWLILLGRQYQVQVVPVATAVAVQYAARTALAAHPGVGQITIWVGKVAYHTTIKVDGVEVRTQGEQMVWVPFSNDASGSVSRPGIDE